MSLRTGKLPVEWKIAKVISINKNKGSRDIAMNYSVVSSIVWKVMKNILKCIILHLEEKGFLTVG